MSGKRAWPHRTGVDLKYDRCVYALGQYWWAREHPIHRDVLLALPLRYGRAPAEVELRLKYVEDTLHLPRPQFNPTTSGLNTQLYSAVGVSPVGMFWVKQPYGPLETLRAPYDEILELVKKLVEKYPDTTYTVVKVCAEVRTPPKPTLEVTEY